MRCRGRSRFSIPSIHPACPTDETANSLLLVPSPAWNCGSWGHFPAMILREPYPDPSADVLIGQG